MNFYARAPGKARIYAVDVWLERSTKRAFKKTYRSLRVATREFQRQCAVHVADAESTVLLTDVDDPVLGGGSTLAAKYNDKQDVIFYPAFYREGSESNAL